MKLLTYKIKKFETPQIGVLQNQLVYNLNNCFIQMCILGLGSFSKTSNPA